MTIYAKRIIFHIDVNSAFLSWTAVYRLKNGEKEDIRNIPSAVGGDESSRHGIVLAKSTPAKAYGIVTGESLFSARKKCPSLKIFPASFDIYRKYSRQMMKIIKEYTPKVEQYSIDECFLDVTCDIKKAPLDFAYEIKERIKNELGFTVNVGISSNRMLAKMASELKKPDKINTLYPEEIKSKMWPLPVSELFMVGRSTRKKLKSMYIDTIGDLANYDVNVLKNKFKSYGKTIWEYANGIDNSKIECNDDSDMKSISNDATFSHDITNSCEAHKEIMELCDHLSERLRKSHKFCSSISVSIRNSRFSNYSHQVKLKSPTDSTSVILNTAKSLFDETWKKEPIRLISVQLSKLCDKDYQQVSLFEQNVERNRALDKAIDSIREKYGENAVMRSVFLNKKSSGKD